MSGNPQISDFRLSAIPPLVLCNKYVRDVQVIFAKEFSYNVEGRAMAQALNRLAAIAEALVLFPAAPCALCGGQIATGAGFSPSTSVFSSQFYSTNTAYCEIYLIPNRLRETGFSVIAVDDGIRIRMYFFYGGLSSSECVTLNGRINNDL